MRNKIIKDVVLSPVAKRSQLIKEPLRVLYITSNKNTGKEVAIVIPISPQRSSGRIYYRTYSYILIDLLAKELHEKRIAITKIKARPITLKFDHELKEMYRPNKDGTVRILKDREDRFNLIEPLIKQNDENLLFDREVLNDLIKKRASELVGNDPKHKNIVNQIKCYLNQYWAGGSTKNTLISFYNLSGGRGVPKKVTGMKLGRKPGNSDDGNQNEECFLRDEEETDIIQFSWRNFFVKGATVASAYRRMLDEFYSTLVTDESGNTKIDWLPENKRPTESMFRYWGPKENPDQAAWRRQLSHKSFQRNYRAVPGSAKNQIIAVGQRASVDSTTTDVSLCSILSRLRRIGFANRILIVDAMYDYIPGFYMGLNPASSSTVKLAFLHALTDKKEWLTRLGLEDTYNDWVPMMFSSAIADNTDCRTENVQNALASINTSLLYVETYRSDLNSIAESTHHMLHRSVDHKLAGTTYGKKTPRGETSADLRARHTLIQAYRETTRAIHYHNTVPLDIELPLEMQRDGVRPTRLEMTRWAIENGQVARALIPLDEARVLLLPRCKGTIKPDGVWLLRDDTGDKRTYIRTLRYVSNDPYIRSKMEEARRGGRKAVEHFDAEFLYDPFNTDIIYFNVPYSDRTIELKNCIKDFDLSKEATFADVIEITDANKGMKRIYRNEREVQLGEMERAQRATKEQAEQEYNNELYKSDKKPSKAKLIGNKKENREAEKDIMRDGFPILANTIDQAESSHEFTNNISQEKTEHSTPIDITKPNQVGSIFRNAIRNVLNK
nr:hypothetical protein [uncultured Pseudogulbenkiania sp.]